MPVTGKPHSSRHRIDALVTGLRRGDYISRENGRVIYDDVTADAIAALQQSEREWADASIENREEIVSLEEQLQHSVEDVASLTAKNLSLIEQLETAREAVQACYDDLQRYAPPHWRNQGRGEILARNFLTSFPANEPEQGEYHAEGLDERGIYGGRSFPASGSESVEPYADIPGAGQRGC